MMSDNGIGGMLWNALVFTVVIGAATDGCQAVVKADNVEDTFDKVGLTVQEKYSHGEDQYVATKKDDPRFYTVGYEDKKVGQMVLMELPAADSVLSKEIRVAFNTYSMTVEGMRAEGDIVECIVSRSENPTEKFSAQYDITKGMVGKIAPITGLKWYNEL